MAEAHGNYPKGRRRRAELIDLALEVFAVEGYRGTSLRTVAQRAGLSVAGVLHHFDSREHLLAEVIARRDTRACTPGPLAVTPDDLAEVLHRNAEEPGLVELFVTLAAASHEPGHPARPVLAEHYARVVPALTEYFTAHRDRLAPAARDLDPEHLARLAVAVADGAQLQWLVTGEHDLAEPLRTLLQVLTPDPPPATGAGTAPMSQAPPHAL